MKATTDRPEPTEAELNIRRKLAHVLWIQENENTLPEDMDARKEMFQSSKVGYLRRARNLVQRLKNHGIELTEQPD
ncbi:hypothetical protein A3720_14385 [Sulfitobacter sp. HI0021]|nr:hypothetical protein A3720_14385 [Sulfitobacter sp. HI0021]